MANKSFIEFQKRLQKRIEMVTPEIFASLVLALRRGLDMSDEDIGEVLEQSQIIWNECVENGVNMVDMCLEETGIDVRQATMERN